MTKLILKLSFFALVFLSITISAWAESTTCTGTLSGGTFESIVVPAGAICTIFNSIVNGSISALDGSQLFLEGGVTVNGSISGVNPAFFYIDIETAFGANTINGNVSTIGALHNNFSQIPVLICGTTIRGNVLIADGQDSVGFGGEEPGAACQLRGGGNTVLSGNVRVESNNVTTFRVADNSVDGNVRIEGNTGTATKRVLNNDVGLNLTCNDNASPFVIGGNSAKKLIGQCKP